MESLLEKVKKVCDQLVHWGWHDILLQFGLDIDDQLDSMQLKKELLKNLPNIDREINGFQDFAVEGHRGIEPGIPAQSLLYHALASPNVIKGARGEQLGKWQFPELSQIESVENYVFGVRPPSIQDLTARAKDIATRVEKSTGQAQDAFMAIAVFATEYRPAPQTVHQNHADMCFSRTGVARVGTTGPEYDPAGRGFIPFLNDNYEFHVLPARYSPYIAVQLTGEKDIFGPMRFDLSDRQDGTRKFWVPLHKLFNGNECIYGLDLKITLQAYHVNEKIKRIHLQLETIPGYSATERTALENPPYKFSNGIAELSADPKLGSGVLVPTPHKETC